MSDSGATPDQALDATEAGTSDVSAEGAMLMRRLASRLFDEEYQPVHVGRFALLRTIGSGGMGVVHLAYDETLDRRVAIKLIRRERSASSMAHEQTLREARAMARLSHPHVVQIYEAGEYDDGVFIAMEYVEGQTLGEWRRETKPDWRRCVQMYVAAGRGLAAAHLADVIHRDFKPDNVLLTTEGVPKVGDFGLAGLPDAAAVSGGSITGDIPERTRAAVGTPRYMPPEQFRAEPADERSDQYSFCVALYEAIYDEAPFRAQSVEELAYKVTEGEREQIPSTPVIPGRIRAAIERGMSARPVDRFPSMNALLAELAPPAGSRKPLVVATVASVSLAASLAWLTGADEACTGASDHLAEVWNDGRRAKIASAVEADGRPYLVRAWERAGPALDGYAAGWIEQHTAACRATRVTEEQSVSMLDRRMACLHRARASLLATTDVLLAADAEQLGRLDALVGGLPPLQRCADVEALEADVPLPTLDEKEAVEAITETLAKIVAMQAAGQIAQTEPLVEQAEAQLEGLSYEPARTRVLLVKGATQSALRKGEPFETLAQAQVSALSQGYWSAALDATVRLAFGLAVVEQRFAEAESLWTVGEGLLAYTDDLEDRARFLAHRGAARSADARYDDAIRDLKTAIEAWEELGPENMSKRVNARSNLAETYIRNGDTEAAEGQLRIAIGELVERYGPGHPIEARLHYNLGRVFERRSDGKKAAAEFDKAVQLGQETMPGHPFLANFAIGRASAAYIQGHYGEAAERLSAVIDGWKERLGVDHPSIAAARSQLTASLTKLGQFEQAEEQARRSIELLEGRYGKGHARTASPIGNLAEVLLERGKLEEAAAACRRELEINLATIDPAEPRLVRGRVDLAAILVRQGKLDEAERELGQALEAYEGNPPSPARQASAKETLASLRRARGDLDGALAAIEQARQLLVNLHGEDHRDITAVTVTVGEIHLERKDYARAAEELSRAVERMGELEMSPALRGAGLFALARTQWQQGQRDQGLANARKALLEHEASKAGDAEERAERVRTWLADPSSPLD